MTKVKITVQGTTADTVSLNDLAVVGDQQAQPSGIAVGQCGGQPPVHSYQTNLNDG